MQFLRFVPSLTQAAFYAAHPFIRLNLPSFPRYRRPLLFPDSNPFIWISPFFEDRLPLLTRVRSGSLQVASPEGCLVLRLPFEKTREFSLFSLSFIRAGSLRPALPEVDGTGFRNVFIDLFPPSYLDPFPPPQPFFLRSASYQSDNNLLLILVPVFASVFFPLKGFALSCKIFSYFPP